MRTSFNDLVSTRAIVLLHHVEYAGNREVADPINRHSHTQHLTKRLRLIHIESILIHHTIICRQHSLYQWDNYRSHCNIANPPISFRLNAIRPMFVPIGHASHFIQIGCY
jgi:hypothetical protein